MIKQRIQVLDGFRLIAILSVFLYHLTSSWIITYPFGNTFLHIFKYGYLGVQFFFMISGFVISYTLSHTPNLFSFYRNRFSRLFPGMVLCSLVTFIVISLLDDQLLFKNAHEIQNFVPSLTFINPPVWTLATKNDFHWINGSYWSLWVEIQFYIVASGLYFLNKKAFPRNLLLIGIIISLIKYIPGDFLNSYSNYIKTHGLFSIFYTWRNIDELFNLPFYIRWFLLGSIFYQLYSGFDYKKNIPSVIYMLIVLVCLLRDVRTFSENTFMETIIASMLMIVLFLLMINRNKYLFFLENRFLTRIGMISYTIYLIHEDIGVLLICKYGIYLGRWSILSPFLILILTVGFAELSYWFYEKQASAFIKKTFSRRYNIPTIKNK